MHAIEDLRGFAGSPLWPRNDKCRVAAAES